MAKKKDYIVETNDLVYRRANIGDNLEEIAELIYKTDPYIYPFWFNGNLEEAKKYLPKLMRTPGNLFYIDNLYIAVDMNGNHVLGVLCAIDKTSELNYRFEEDKKINHNYDFTINNYVLGIQNEVPNFESDSIIYISNICVSEAYRGRKIGSCLIGYFLSQMETAGYTVFELDCLLHNLRAKNLYHSMGFKEMKEIIGFDGTDNSKVEVVSFLRKKGDYYPKEFQVSILDSENNNE